MIDEVLGTKKMNVHLLRLQEWCLKQKKVTLRSSSTEKGWGQLPQTFGRLHRTGPPIECALLNGSRVHYMGAHQNEPAAGPCMGQVYGGQAYVGPLIVSGVLSLHVMLM